jgi:hypothetical protein
VINIPGSYSEDDQSEFSELEKKHPFDSLEGYYKALSVAAVKVSCEPTAASRVATGHVLFRTNFLSCDELSSYIL